MFDISIPNLLHRYTDRVNLNLLLEEGLIRFSNWRHWIDENDKALLDIYENKKRNAVFVFCMTNASETIHHWSSYSKKQGCRIKFNTEVLSQYFKKYDIIAKPVQYIKQQDLSSLKLSVDDLPFIKRHPYRVETEFRLIKNLKKRSESFCMKVSSDVIQEISLSPFNKPAYNELQKRSLIKKYPFLETKFSNSKMIKYDQWINHFNNHI